MRNYFWSLLTSLLTLILVSGCQTENKEETTFKPPNMNYAWQGFPQPAPTPQASKILVEKLIPKKVKPNEVFTFTIDIRNNTDYAVSDVIINEKIPPDFKLIKANIPPARKASSLQWDLGTLKPGIKKKIEVTGKISSPGAARYFGDTDLHFDLGQTRSEVDVIHPKLTLSLDAPRSVIITETIPVTLTFKNNGSAPVIGTKLIHTLPKNLLTDEGKSKIDLLIGDLKPGEQKVEKLTLRAEETGTFSTTFEAVAEEGISAKADFNINVTKPELKITGTAPGKRYVGDIIPYEVNVKNVGNATTKEVEVYMDLPEGTELTSADEGGKITGQTVIWKINSLTPNESKKLVAKVVVNKIMIARVVATAKTLGTDPVKAVMVTDVAGVAALLGRLVDTNDPVPLGENEIYELTVTNQGSLPATKIKVKCILEDAMEYVKSSGATKGTLKGKTLTFNPLPALAPHSNATWRITVKAIKRGDVRFAVYVESDQLTKPVELKEATHFYE